MGTMGQDLSTDEMDQRSMLRQLRRALRRERAASRPSDQERDLALRLRVSRERIAAETGVLQACARCAAQYPLSARDRVGGYCCGGRTEVLFDEIELAALSSAGMRPRHLRPPRAKGLFGNNFRTSPNAAGCLFWGVEGCSLPPRHRPNKCLRYLCRDAQREVHVRGGLELVEALCRDNERQFEQFARLRLARLERSFCEELLRRVF
jgi:hypothetical protein